MPASTATNVVSYTTPWDTICSSHLSGTIASRNRPVGPLVAPKVREAAQLPQIKATGLDTCCNTLSVSGRDAGPSARDTE
jgi:hypothetical protein